MKQESFMFVPARVVVKHSLPTDGTISLDTEMVLKTTDGFYTRGSVLVGEDDAVRAFVENAGLEVGGASVVDDRLYLILSLKRSLDEVIITHQLMGDEEEKPELDTSKYPIILNDARDALTKFGGQTGFNPVMHFRRKEVCNLFPDDDEDTLHIIVGASPPGAVDSMSRQHACGVRLHHKNYWRVSNGPTPGRGSILRDENKIRVAQIEGRNVFLFTPQISIETAPLFSSEGGDLLRKLLQLISKVLAEGVEKEAEATIESPTAYAVYLQNRVCKELSFLEDLIVENDNELAKAQQTYQEALSSKRQHIALKEIIERRFSGGIEKYAAADWTRLTEDHRVSGVSVIDLALYVKTKRVHYEEDGKRYDLGEFMIRLVLGGQLSVWSLAPTHPKGIAHPHISELSTFCFGNVGIEIEKAASELRLGDAIELVLEWLINGYDATLATHKIEEWPEVG